MSEALKAHLRLLELLPRRTHEWKTDRVEWGYKRSDADNARLGEKLRELEAKGLSRNDMARECGCGSSTIIRHLGRMKR